MPKSASLAVDRPCRRPATFWGLMARWTIPCAWAWERASQRSAPISAMSWSLSSPARAALAQGAALDELGDHQPDAVLVPELIERHDAGVVEAGRGVGLAQDPLPGLPADLDRLHGDVPLEAAVPGAVDGTEASTLEALVHPEALHHDRADHVEVGFRLP